MKIRILAALTSLSFWSATQAAPLSQAFVETKIKDVRIQDTASGWVDGQNVSGLTRNWYSRERATKGPIYKHFNADGSKSYSHKRDNWLQSTIVTYSSGFTQGDIGFAAQVAAYNAIALERDRADVGGPNNRTLTDSSGNVQEQWSKMGLANIMARISNTTLAIGRQAVNTPVLAVYGNRALPSSFEGASLVSDEFNNLSFQGGLFDRVSPRTEQSQTKLRTKYEAHTVESDRLSLLGVDYKPSAALTATLYASELEDIWRQYYVGIKHSVGDRAEVSLSSAIGYYHTQHQGKALLGSIDNDAYSLALTVAHHAHSVTLAWQQVMGNEYFDVVSDSGADYLANYLYSDYNGPNEKSTRIGYDLNMAYYGLPGLTLNIYTARGWGIDGTNYNGTGYNVQNLDGEHHYEYGVGGGYTVQSGKLKDSSLKALYWAHRASVNQIDGNLNELRIITTVPF